MRLPGFPIVLHGASSVPQEYVREINALGGKHNLADVLHLLRVEQRIELGIVADQYTQRDSFRSRGRCSRTSS